MQHETLLLGIDGGGTKTETWLAASTSAAESTVIGRGSAGPANPQAVGLAQATENLDRSVAAAFDDAGRLRQTVRVAVMALAGSDRDTSRRELTAWADGQCLAESLQVVHDALPVLMAGCSAGWGVALISGTGSFAFGRTRDGQVARAGGWGYLFGDEGSGYALGLAGLRATAQAADGCGPATQLTAAIVQHLGIRQPQELVQAIYQAADCRTTVAALAPLVVAIADQGDAESQQIVDRAAADLATMVVAVAKRLDLTNTPLPLALAGGTLLGSRRLQSATLDRIVAAGCTLAATAEVRDPVRGAVALAQREAFGL
jgi:N-acetylmuramic acid 6-phosphate etherase